MMGKIEFRLEALLTVETGDLKLRNDQKQEIAKVIETKLPERITLLDRRLRLSDVRLRVLEKASKRRTGPCFPPPWLKADS